MSVLMVSTMLQRYGCSQMAFSPLHDVPKSSTAECRGEETVVEVAVDEFFAHEVTS